MTLWAWVGRSGALSTCRKLAVPFLWPSRTLRFRGFPGPGSRGETCQTVAFLLAVWLRSKNIQHFTLQAQIQVFGRTHTSSRLQFWKHGSIYFSTVHSQDFITRLDVSRGSPLVTTFWRIYSLSIQRTCQCQPKTPKASKFPSTHDIKWAYIQTNTQEQQNKLL